jgi:uncharacterized protein (TIGR02246 family)
MPGYDRADNGEGVIAVRIRFGAALAAVLTLVSASADALESPLAAVSQSWARNWQARDLSAVLALYCPDATFVDADGTRTTGLAAIRPFFASVLKQFRAQPSLVSVRSGRSDTLGYDSGDYSETITPLAHPERAFRTHGTYLVILRETPAGWCIVEQVWTGRAPEALQR